MFKLYAPELAVEQLQKMKNEKEGIKLWPGKGFINEMIKGALPRDRTASFGAAGVSHTVVPPLKRRLKLRDKKCLVLPRIESAESLTRQNSVLVDYISQQGYNEKDIVIATELPVYEGTVTFSEALDPTLGCLEFFMLVIINTVVVEEAITRPELIGHLKKEWGYPYDNFC